MAPKSDNTEAIVINFVNEQNKPLNMQNAADALQKFNLKKTAVQKALDSLADAGKITFKEYDFHTSVDVEASSSFRTMLFSAAISFNAFILTSFGGCLVDNF